MHSYSSYAYVNTSSMLTAFINTSTVILSAVHSRLEGRLQPETWPDTTMYIIKESYSLI